VRGWEGKCPAFDRNINKSFSLKRPCFTTCPPDFLLSYGPEDDDNLEQQLLYSELSNKHAANVILFEKCFPPTCLIRTYTFIYFWGKFQPTRLLKPTHLIIFGEIPNYKIILSSFKLLFCCFKHFKVASKS
jgi:hypothetical protein